MLAEETRDRQSRLEACLYEMASTLLEDEALNKMATRLKVIYTGHFRHNYSAFFPLVIKIGQENGEYNLDYLSNNIELLRLLVETDYVVGTKQFKSLYPHLERLSDHLNLEIGRLAYYSQREQKVDDIERRYTELSVKTQEATRQLNKASRKAASTQTELVAILSIFSAIIIAFFGGINFIAAALSGMAAVHIFKAVLVCTVCGAILANTVFLLLYLIAKITERNIYARCESENCTCGENGRPKCRSTTRIRKRLPYVFWLNTALLAVSLMDIIFWMINFYTGGQCGF